MRFGVIFGLCLMLVGCAGDSGADLLTAQAVRGIDAAQPRTQSLASRTIADIVIRRTTGKPIQPVKF